MKLTKTENTYTLTKKELEKLLNIKITRMYCHDMSHMQNPSYDLTIYTNGDEE